MNCPKCGTVNQNYNVPCSQCGTVTVSMTQQVIIPPPPPLVYQVAQTPPPPPGQQPQVVVPRHTPWWAWVLITLGVLGLATAIVLGTVALAKGATSNEIAASEKVIVAKVDNVDKKVDIVDGKVKNMNDNLLVVDGKVKNMNDNLLVVDGKVMTVNDNLRTLDDNVAEEAKETRQTVTDEGKATRQAVTDETKKVRWSIKRSQRNFDDIAGKLDRLERIKPTVNVRIEK